VQPLPDTSKPWGSGSARAGFLQDADGRDKNPPVVVVNESFVRTFWGAGADAVGRRIRYRDKDAKWITASAWLAT
jgi:hypothetical protein